MKVNIVIPINVMKVLRRLERFDYQAFLVGGCIKDHFLGITPKDWDVSTDATPEEIAKVFDNSRIVGRRFPIVHVCFAGGEIIEVVTFRTDGDDYGTMVDDSYRRDYTVNALYYDASSKELIDPFSGYQDLIDRKIVCIGNPVTRITGDPVRMLRAARLIQQGFTLDCDVSSAIESCGPMLKTVNCSRLYCEFVKMFKGRCQSDSALILDDLGLLVNFFPRKMYNGIEPWHGELKVSSIICHIVWEYYCDLVRACMSEFNLHPIPSSQKAAKLLVKELRGRLNTSKAVALAIKCELSERYREELECD